MFKTKYIKFTSITELRWSPLCFIPLTRIISDLFDLNSGSLTMSYFGYRYREWSPPDPQHRTVRVHAWPSRRRGDKDAHPWPQRHPYGPRPGSGHFPGVTGLRGNEDHRGETCMCSETWKRNETIIAILQKCNMFNYYTVIWSVSYNVANVPVIQIIIITSNRMRDNSSFQLKILIRYHFLSNLILV